MDVAEFYAVLCTVLTAPQQEALLWLYRKSEQGASDYELVKERGQTIKGSPAPEVLRALHRFRLLNLTTDARLHKKEATKLRVEANENMKYDDEESRKYAAALRESAEEELRTPLNHEVRFTDAGWHAARVLAGDPMPEPGKGPPRTAPLLPRP